MSNVIDAKDKFEERQGIANVERCARVAEKIIKKQEEEAIEASVKAALSKDWDAFKQSMFDIHIRPLFDTEDLK